MQYSVREVGELRGLTLMASPGIFIWEGCSPEGLGTEVSQ